MKLNLVFLLFGAAIAATSDEVAQHARTLRKKHPNRGETEIEGMAREHLAGIPQRPVRDTSIGMRTTLAQWNRLDRNLRYSLYTAAYGAAHAQLELAGYPSNRNVRTDDIIAKMKQQLSYRADFPPFPDVVLQEAVGSAKRDMINGSH